MPLQPAATTVNGRLRRWTPTRSASNVSRAPTASPHVPIPTARRAPVRRRSASRRSEAKRAAGGPAVGGGGGLARTDAEPPLARGEKLASTPHATAQARAHSDEAAPGRGQAQLRVV